MKKTEYIQLSLWEAGDRVLREDFNADNGKIDAAIAALGQHLAGQGESLRQGLEAQNATLRKEISAVEARANNNTVQLSQTLQEQIKTSGESLRSAFTGEIGRLSTILGIISQARTAVGSYTGNGGGSRFITLPASPKFLVLSGYTGSSTQDKRALLSFVFQGGGCHEIYHNGVHEPETGHVVIEGNGFWVHPYVSPNPSFPATPWHNVPGVLERYFAIW
jgi:hypothetical protein